MSKPKRNLKVAVGGFGAIGKAVAKALDDGIEGLELAAVSANNVAKAEGYMNDNFSKVFDVRQLSELADVADVVVECCPAKFISDIASPVLKQGKYTYAYERTYHCV